MTTLTGYVVNPALYREVGIEAQPGDQVEIYLDQDRVPGFPEFILGTIQNPVTAVCGGTSYDIEYDEADLDGSGVEFIADDDIVSTVVVSEARVLFAAEQTARMETVTAVVRTRAEGYPTPTARRRVTDFAGAALPGDLSGILVYEIDTPDVFVNPVVNTEAAIVLYEVYAILQRESNGSGGYRYSLSITRDGIETGEWLSVTDSITAPMYAVSGSGADAAATAVVKTAAVTVTELVPSFVGQHCIVGSEVFIATSETGSWHKLLTFTL